MPEWCDCPNEFTSGHLSLEPVAELWVHGECLRPSIAWWRAFTGKCENCGKYGSYPAARLCQTCGGETWADLAALWRDYWQEIWQEGRKRLDPSGLGVA